MNTTGYNISISEKIIAYRRQNGLSQNELGKLLGVSAQAVCKWEKGLCYPDITFLPQLSKLLGCPIDDFFEQQ